MSYTYFLKNKVTGEKYYGVRYARGCSPEELWLSYFSSSKVVAARIQEHGVDSFEYYVRRTFTHAQAARDWEEKVLRRLDVLHRPEWLNRNICGKYLKEGPQSPEHIRKRIGRMAKTRRAIGWHNPPLSSEQRAAISKRLKGMKKSSEHVAHMKCHERNKEIVTCPTCGKTGQYVNMKRWHFDNCGKERKLYTCPHCGASKAIPGVMRHHFDNCKHKVQ